MIVLVVLGMLWARRPRWHRTSALAAHGEDPALRRLARLGGDWPAHVTVHGGPRRLTEGNSR